MIRLLQLLFLLTLFSGWSVASQEATPLSKSNNVIEKCVKIAEPPDNWTFDGTIITYRWGDGLHGFRADTPSRYFIAFDDDATYLQFGALSPTGQWLASYVGRVEQTYSMMFNKDYFVTSIRVVSTLPRRETYSVPFQSYEYNFSPHFMPILWLSNSQLAAYSETSSGIDEKWYVIDPFAGTASEASQEQVRQIKESDVLAQGIYQRVYGYLTFPSIEAVTVNPLPRAFILAESPGSRGRLYVIDLKTQQIYDTCIETSYPFAISPTGDQVAISSDKEEGFVYVLDLNDWAAYRLNLAANRIVAWVADP